MYACRIPYYCSMPGVYANMHSRPTGGIILTMQIGSGVTLCYHVETIFYCPGCQA